MVDPALKAQIANFERVVLRRDAELAGDVLHVDYALVLVQPEPVVMPRDRWLALLPDYVVEAYDVQSQQLDVLGICAAHIQRLR